MSEHGSFTDEPSIFDDDDTSSGRSVVRIASVAALGGLRWMVRGRAAYCCAPTRRLSSGGTRCAARNTAISAVNSGAVAMRGLAHAGAVAGVQAGAVARIWSARSVTRSARRCRY